MKNIKFELPESEVTVKLLKCPVCKGVIRVAVKHLMGLKDRNSFSKEALNYNLEIAEIPLLEYREGVEWCSCKK